MNLQSNAGPINITAATGAAVGSPIGGPKGAGSLNAQKLYYNGTDLAPAQTTAVCANAAGDGAIIQTAVSTGKTVRIQGPCVLDSSVTFANPGQEIFGDGQAITILTQSSVLATGSFICTSGEQGPYFRDFQIAFTQPDTAVRANLTAYNPAFACQATPRARWERVSISRAIIGIDIQGNSGGSYIIDAQISAFSKSIIIDGSLDTVRIDKAHIFPFNLTANQTTIYNSTTIPAPGCASTTTTYGIVVGRSDDIKITDSLFISGGPQFCAFFGSGGPGGTSWSAGPMFGDITGADFDGSFAVEFTNQGSLRINNSSLTVNSTATPFMYINGSGVRGLVTCTGCWFYTGAASGVNPSISLFGNAALNITGSMIQYADGVDATFISNTGGSLTFNSNNFSRSSATYTKQIIDCSSTFASCVIEGNTTQNATTGAVFASISTDLATNKAWGNSLAAGWTTSYPAGNLGQYDVINLASAAAQVTGILAGANGGTGVANTGSTITLGGNLTTSGAFASTFTMTNTTAVTFPTSGTLATTGGTVASFSAGTTGFTPNSATTGAVTLAGTLVVANGGTNCAVASITCFNNITGFSAAGTTGTTSTNLVFSTSPSISALTVTSSFTATGLVTNADLVNMTTNSVKGTLSGTTPTDLAIGSCDTATKALQWTTNTGFGCNSSITAAAVSGTGLTGATVGGASSTTLASTILASSLTLLGTITSLTATTINAFTLGGDIAGAGKNLNNIIIGATTPLAGTFNALNLTNNQNTDTNLTVTNTDGGAGAAATFTATTEAGSGVMRMASSTNGGAFGFNANGAGGINFLATSAGNITFYTGASPTVKMTLLNSGTLQLPFTANVATTSALCFNTGTGAITYNGTVGTCTISDERLKNMGPRIDHALDRLLSINGVYYTWKNPKSFGAGRQIGVGAQTVEKVFPELVQADSTGYKSADYQRLVAPIIEAIRELKSANDNLRTDVVALKKKVGMQ